MTQTVRPLVEYLAEVGDPRKAKGLRHPLVAILCLCCVVLMSGARNARAIANWWKNRKDSQTLGGQASAMGRGEPGAPPRRQR